MQYRKDKYGNDLSILGYGCMRFHTKMGKIDLEQAEKQIMTAFSGGVNYFDTAYIYPGSEAAVGAVLEKNGIRDKVKIATKLPHYLIKSRDGLDKLFYEQLRRLRTNYIDYYLMHMLADPDTWQRLCDLGIKEWIEGKKKSGEIRQIGFSYHGNTETFKRLVDVYDWDFCMIQYNYMDESSQAGTEGLKYASSKGLPVMIMEPLRGGRLVKLPENARKIMEAHDVKRTPAEWSFRWLWSKKEVTVVLSGMNSCRMIEENMSCANDARAEDIGKAEQRMLDNVVREINSRMKVGCTGCGYCMPCPKGVDIPGTFSAYNRYFSEGRFTGLKEYFMCTALRKNSSAASNCIGCGKCEKHCPQGIKIRTELKNATGVLEKNIYRLGRWLAVKMKF